ncbi:Nuclear factor NF-kappa-B p105 subunit [Paraconiothyrium brasiliense]|uniref:Nuclear factor NF-kappa-B p105 subunit n=1 Tax=Paraconiothyrium brasiliense TaxID=300254 RepID=A0ABR3QSU3_9PLEO
MVNELERASKIQAQSKTNSYEHPWKLPPLGALLFLGIERSFVRYSSSLSGAQLFATFLYMTDKVRSIGDKTLLIQLLLAAANKGHFPAQAVVDQVHDSYDLPQPLPSEVIRQYLYNGMSSGSTLAARQLRDLEPRLATEADSVFRNATGFNQFYSPLKTISLSDDYTKDGDGNTILHQLAAHQQPEKLAQALSQPNGINQLNARNDYGETALYKACLTGCSRSVSLLCQHGADASIPSLRNMLTCLHWLFNFTDTCLKSVADSLVRAGGDPNALGSPTPVIVDYHFPFSWPSGTPLHFAVQAQNLEAVSILLHHRARVNIRDGRDPYISDLDVRQTHTHGDAEFGESSVPKTTPFGFTPVGLAAAMYAHDILDCVSSKSQNKVSLEPDEEGYPPFHRLSYFRTTRTSHGLEFWYPAFKGDSVRIGEKVVQTVKALQRMGGDVDQLTNTPDKPAFQGVSGLSPLMIATLKTDCESVSALLRCGADANAVNRDGRSPLTLLVDFSEPQKHHELIQILLRYDANPNYVSPDGTTSLSAALMADSVACVKLLIAAGAELSSEEAV